MRLRRWVAASLYRKILFTLIICMAVSSVLSLLLSVGLFWNRLERDSNEMSRQVSHLLQVSLENAMLKRDLPGLWQIVRQLATQDKIRNVMILNPAGEVRFSSQPEMLNRTFEADRSETCAICHVDGDFSAEMKTLFMTNEQGVEVLRSVTPVRNKPPCQECHGPVATNPINGILFIDYEASQARKEAILSAAAMTASGALLVLVTVFVAWILLRRFVLRPVHGLSQASRGLADGRLETRVEVTGDDELNALGRRFNLMAENLEHSIQTVAEKEQFLQAVINGAADGIRVIDIDFNIIKANQRYCDIVGQSMSDVMGMPCYRSSHQADAPCPASVVICPVRELEHGDGPLTCTQQFKSSGGRDTVVEVTAARNTLVRDGRPTPVVIETIRDLSQEIKLSHGQYLSELAQLATGVAHEVYNPLASARISLQTIVRMVSEGTADLKDIQDYLKVLDGEIDKCVDVTGRLLRLAEPPARHPMPVNLLSALEDVVALLKLEADIDGVTVNLVVEPPALRVMATESEIRMIFLNLIQNAFHAMPDGGVLDITGVSRGGMACLMFSDNGVGIAAERLKHIFEPFFSRRADRSSGTGLGLAICKAIIERYDGRIEVTSNLGQGTRFEIVFPDADAQIEA